MAAYHYAWRCAEEEGAKLFFKRACSAARCKRRQQTVSRRCVLSSDTGRNQMWLETASNFLSFLREESWGIAPQKLHPVTELLENCTGETHIITGNHNVKHNIVLQLHTFACRVFIDAKPGNSISLDIYSILVK